MRAQEFVAEKKNRRKRKVKAAAYGPGPYGWYGYDSGYSGDGGGDGGGVAEGKMAELDMDLEDPEISDRQFEKMYGMTRKEARELFSKTNMWDFPQVRDPNKPLHEQGVAEGFTKNLDTDYFMNEGCGIFAVAMALTKPGSQIYIISNKSGESWSKSFPYEITHVFVSVPNKGQYDVHGQRSIEAMTHDFGLSKGDYGIKGPFDPKEFFTKFMGSSDNKPLYGTAKDVKELQQQIQNRQGVAESIRVDVPSEEWLQGKIDYAKKKGRDRFGVPGFNSTTAYYSNDVRVPIEILRRLPGMRDEQQRVRQQDLEAIKKILKDTGRLPIDQYGREYAPFVMVAYNGEAWVNEGNHRIMAAAELYDQGDKRFESLPIELKYFDGGERVKSGPLHPSKISKQGVAEGNNNLNFEEGDCPIFAIALHRLSKLPLMALVEYDEEMGSTALIHAYVKLNDEWRVDASGETNVPHMLAKFPNNGSAEEVQISEKDLIKLGYGKNKCPALSEVLPHAKEVLQDIKQGNLIEFAPSPDFRDDDDRQHMPLLEFAEIIKLFLGSEYTMIDRKTPEQVSVKFDPKDRTSGHNGAVLYSVVRKQNEYPTVNFQLIDYEQGPQVGRGRRAGTAILKTRANALKIADIIYNTMGLPQQDRRVEENFADGRNPGRKGLAKRVGVNCKQSVTKLRSIAAKSSGERQRMAHWCANMKSGKKK